LLSANSLNFCRKSGHSPNYGREAGAGGLPPLIRRGEERLALLEMRESLDKVGLAQHLPGRPLRLAFGTLRIFLYAFDLIEFNGDDLRRDPLAGRRLTLEKMLSNRPRFFRIT
jgi:hypothetical protein